MKYIVLVAIVTICFSRLASAQLQFDNSGIVRYTNNGPIIINKDTSNQYSLDTNNLKQWRQKSIDKFKIDLKENLDVSIEALSMSDGDFYLSKWLIGEDSLNKLVAELSQIRNFIDSGSIANRIPANSILVPFAKTLDSVLKSPMFWVSIDRTSPHYLGYQLYQEDILSKFIGEYYNRVISLSENKGIQTVPISAYYATYSELKRQYDSLSHLLGQVYRKVEPETLELMYLAHKSCSLYLDKSRFVKMLRQPFFAQWIWSTGGSIKLNPLDFTAATLIDTVPGHNLLSKTFTNEEFIRRNKALIDENKTSLRKVQFPQQVTHRIDIPIGDTSWNQYFLLDLKARNLQMPKVRPLDKDEKIYLLLVNVPKGYNSRYKFTKTTSISGKSPTEEMVDSAAGTVLKLYNLLNPQAAVIAGITSGLNEKAVGEIPKVIKLTNKNVVLADAGVDTQFDVVFDLKPPSNVEAFWTTMKENLEKLVPEVIKGDDSDWSFYEWEPVSNIEFSEEIFAAVRKKFKSKAIEIVEGNNQEKVKELRKEIVNDYLNKMYVRQIAPIFVDSLQKDSVRLSHLINTLTFSSLPVRKVEIAADTVPVWRSQLLVIDDKSENVEQQVVIDRVHEQKRDSADIVAFAYKKGRRTFVEVSFGLSYTFQPVIVQEKEGNKVSSNDEKFRGVAAVHFYPFSAKHRRGLYKIDEPFFGSWNRINLMLGVGVPKPLDNFYLGVGYDFGPGLKLNTGVHFHKYRQYKIMNNVFIGDEPTYKALVPFASLSINPELVINKILNVF